jgi:glycosyltransferase involved in cell wall biosynthesis
MRIFFIPSWYPSPNSPLTGIFFQDQAQAITARYPAHSIGISTWGQNDERLLLWAKKPLQSLQKITQKPTPKVWQDAPNLFTFFQPTFTWTRKIKRGNLQEIIRANEKNLLQFQEWVGKVDVIHAHVGFPAGYIARALSQKYNLQYVITEQMSPFPFPYFLRTGKLIPELALAYQDAKQNIAISHSLLQDMSNHNVPRLAYVPNLIDEDFFQVIPKEPAEKIHFFFLGRMVEQKGVPVLLEAIQILTKQYPNVHFTLGGEGEQKNAYQQLAYQRGIDKYLTWLGELGRQEARSAFQACDIFVLPSIHETMGVVLAEALACGKPLVSTYCGGAESVVTPQNGVLAEVGKADDLSQKMAYMIQNLASFPAHLCRQDAVDRFSKKVIIDQLLAIYQG